MRERTSRSERSPGRGYVLRSMLALTAALASGCGGDGSEERTANALAPALSRDSMPAAPSTSLTPSATPTPSSATTPEVSNTPTGTPVAEAMGAPPALLAPETIDASGDLVLDELTDTDALFAAGNVSGEWFTYSDGTSPIAPPDHTGLGAIDGEAHVSGTGFSLWGAGLSAYFRSVDLTAFDGVRLRARGAGVIVVELATPATSPAAEGGTCVGDGCFGHFATSITLGEAYQDFDIPFASLVQPTWAQPAALALDGVISLNLVAKVAATPASIDLWVDRLALHAAP